MMLDPAQFWPDTLKHITDADRHELRVVMAHAEMRRKLAHYNTGTITELDALLLRALSKRFVPKKAVEIGTFIGTSTFSIKAGHLYTCDKDNACVPSSKSITTYPRTRSTKMLQDLCSRLRSREVSFWFFDGRIKNEDLPYIVKLASDIARYVVHDYEGREKGVLNIEKLTPVLPSHYTLIPPPEGSTVAVFMPGHGE